jgi:hypothetical protein
MAFDMEKALAIKIKFIRRQNRASLASSFVDRIFPSFRLGVDMQDKISSFLFSPSPFYEFLCLI